MRYAIAITMIGDVGCPSNQLTMIYRNNGVKIADAKSSQDFTAINYAKPTTYARESAAEGKATEVRKACSKIHNSLKRDKINRHFVVRVVSYEEPK